MTKGKFIAFEGPETTSLASYAKNLVEELSYRNISSTIFQEPSNGPIGLQLRVYEEQRVDFHPFPLSVLRLADRLDQQNLKKDGIQALLEYGVSVIKIHYLLSAYSQFDEIVSIDWLKQINKICFQPDIIVYVDLSEETSCFSEGGRNTQDKEKLKFILSSCEDCGKILFSVLNNSHWQFIKEQVLQILSEKNNG